MAELFFSDSERQSLLTLLRREYLKLRADPYAQNAAQELLVMSMKLDGVDTVLLVRRP